MDGLLSPRAGTRSPGRGPGRRPGRRRAPQQPMWRIGSHTGPSFMIKPCAVRFDTEPGPGREGDGALLTGAVAAAAGPASATAARTAAAVVAAARRRSVTYGMRNSPCWDG